MGSVGEEVRLAEVLRRRVLAPCPVRAIQEIAARELSAKTKPLAIWALREAFMRYQIEKAAHFFGVERNTVTRRLVAEKVPKYGELRRLGLWSRGRNVFGQ